MGVACRNAVDPEERGLGGRGTFRLKCEADLEQQFETTELEAEDDEDTEEFHSWICAFNFPEAGQDGMGQQGLPLILFGAGLPQLAGLAGEAKSYAERLFDYPAVGPLDEAEAQKAIREPIRDEKAEITPEALERIAEKTEGYPYFLQEWGSQAWNIAPESPITRSDVDAATQLAVAALDAGFFRVRLDRLTPREKDYLRAMAELGPGPLRSGEIADVLRTPVTYAAPVRSSLIRKGMIYSPSHGETAFTVPMFDDFLRRTIPHWEPAARQGRSGKKG